MYAEQGKAYVFFKEVNRMSNIQGPKGPQDPFIQKETANRKKTGRRCLCA